MGRPPAAAERHSSGVKYLIAVLACALLLGILLGAACVRVCAAPLDISGTTTLPSEVTSFKELDAVAYPAHVLLGDLLERLGCNPTASALQWFKAAAHAQTPAQVEQTAKGISAAAQRDSSRSDLVRAFCAAVADGRAGPQQAKALTEAGFHCDQ